MAMGRNARRDSLEPLCRFVKFEATDSVELYGLLFEPKRASTRVVIFLHGTGGASIFDTRRTNPLAEVFTSNGIAFFPFNNRGAGIIRRLHTRGKKKRTIKGGMAYERIADCVQDIDGAIAELRSRGYRDFTLMGHSTGANKIVVYDHYKRINRVGHYVFLAGGDDVGLMYDELGGLRFRWALRRARARRNSEELVPFSMSDVPMSWRSFYDLANPDGDYNTFPFLEVMRRKKLSKRTPFRYLRAIRRPSIMIYGEKDEYFIDKPLRYMSVLAGVVGQNPNFELVLVKDADHGFTGREEEIGNLISGWLRRDDRG